MFYELSTPRRFLVPSGFKKNRERRRASGACSISVLQLSLNQINTTCNKGCHDSNTIASADVNFTTYRSIPNPQPDLAKGFTKYIVLRRASSKECVYLRYMIVMLTLLVHAFFFRHILCIKALLRFLVEL